MVAIGNHDNSQRFHSTHPVLGDTVLTALQTLVHQLFTTTIWGQYYYPHFKDEGSEAERH